MTASLRSLPKATRFFWILLAVALLNSAMWMSALHHHDDFSQDNTDCIFCQGVANPAAPLSRIPVAREVHLIAELCPVDQVVSVILADRILAHSPKTGPPAFVSPA